MVVVTDSAYEFVPPYEGNLWPKLLASVASRVLKKQHCVTEIEFRGEQKLASLIDQGHGILIAPNHCRMSDALVLQQLSRKLSQPFFTMASSHLFRGSKWQKFLLRRIGAFSVNREGVDRKSVDAAIEILLEATRPLVIFPEGALSQANERLMALMQGVPFIARSAARKLEKQNKANNEQSDSTPGQERQIYVVPVALRYLFKGDFYKTVNPILSEIEKQLTWRTQSDKSTIERVYQAGEALLGLKEIEYLGESKSGDINQRLIDLVDGILDPMETEWLKERTEDLAVGRVKELRKAIVPDMIAGNTEQQELSKQEIDRRFRQLDDMAFAQAISLFPERYVASNPTIDRVLETVQRMVENLTGKEQAHGPTKAIVEIGEPLAVQGKRDRKATSDPVLSHLEDNLTTMLAELSKECRPVPEAT